MTKLSIYNIIILSGCMALVSCADKNTSFNEEPHAQFLDEISVTRATRAVGEDADGDDENTTGDETPAAPYDGEDIFDTEFIENESVLYVSQRTRTKLPFAENNQTYKYIYYTSQYATWEEGYNFKPSSEGYDPETEINPNALNWEQVGKNGSVGNGFALYAMYYPGQVDKVRRVGIDQSTLSELKNSDILAAYHSTSALYSRVRFKLHHLMVYFKINLFVPVFGETEKTEGGKLENQGFSGYTAQSLVDALVINACPDFTVDWSANISSEASPAVNIPDNYKNSLTDIRMYSHGHVGDEMKDETVPGPTPDEPEMASTRDANDNPEETVDYQIRPIKKTRIEISQFLPPDMINIQPMDPAEDGKLYDEVFQYSFSVIIPAQYPDFTSQTPGFLKFAFKRPSTNTDKNYYFSSGFSSNSQTSVLEPTKGSLQVLNLYLPRKGDEVILVGAEIKEWDNVQSDMNLPQKDQDDNTNP